MLLAAESARKSLENARAVPRNMLRGNWSSTTISASEASGVACQRSSAPRSANSQVARNRRRISASKISDFSNQALRGRPRSRESGAPNQKSRTTEKPGAFIKSLPGPAPGAAPALVPQLPHRPADELIDRFVACPDQGAHPAFRVGCPCRSLHAETALRDEAAVAQHLFFYSSRRRHTRLTCDWSSDVCSSD